MNSYLGKDFFFFNMIIIAPKLKSCDEKEKKNHHFKLSMSYKRKEI